MNVKNAGKHSACLLPFIDMKRLTLEGNPMKASNVAKLSLLVLFNTMNSL